MGLIDKIKSTLFDAGGDMPQPNAASFHVAPGTVYAPVTGMVVSLDEVRDEVIAGGLFGKGCGIVPQVGVVYAPANGRVKATTVTNHAIGMTMAGGVDILIHVGIDTIKMNGHGFSRFVEDGQEAVAGTPLMTFDIEAIKEAGLDDVVTCVVTNHDSFAGVKNVATSGTLIGGRPLVKVGDPLLQVSAL